MKTKLEAVVEKIHSDMKAEQFNKDISTFVGIIDFFLSLVLTLIILIIQGIISIITMITSRSNDDKRVNKTKDDDKRVSQTDDDILSNSEINEIFNDDNCNIIDIYNEDLYDDESSKN